MKYCSQCASPVSQAIPEGDNRLRFVCNNCESIFYSNPKIVAGTLPVYQGKVLLCKRAIEPRYGLWTLPAGFLEEGESVRDGALRETLEEACAEVEIERLFAITSVLHVDHIQMIYLATLPEPVFASSSESLEVALFDEAEIPWQQLAFPTIAKVLQQYFADRSNNHIELHENSWDGLNKRWS